MNIFEDNRIVMTLDAGGTNFVFSAISGGKEIAGPVSLPANGSDIGACLGGISDGFAKIKSMLPAAPDAISFAFPGPADYPAGIIGDLCNLPCFRGGIPLGPMLEDDFGVPVFINNDGDLFAYGEAIAGFLPKINSMLQGAGSPKKYRNLFGITLGTGFGGGIVRDGNLFIGDNSAAGEIWVTRSKPYPNSFAEEGVSIRAVKRYFTEESGIAPEKCPEPKELHSMALTRSNPLSAPARVAFNRLGEAIGDALANAITLIDGLVVIGGGLAGAADLFMPSLINEMNGTIETLSGSTVPRMELKAYNIEDESQKAAFIAGGTTMINVPGTGRQVPYDPMKRVAVSLSTLGTSRAVSIGAYAFALNELDKN